MPEVGQHIGSFILREWIASDKHTSLFRAEALASQNGPQHVAIRIPNVRGDKTARGIIKREHSVLRMVHHDQIPAAITFVDTESASIRSWIEGVSLQDVLQHISNISFTSAIEIILEVCSILQAMHQYTRKGKQLVYGRLSPEHIIITPNGEITLIGLGRNPWNNNPHYMSPEQAEQAFLDWRTDQWSLGSLFVELFTLKSMYGDQRNPFGAAKNAHIDPYISSLQKDQPKLFPLIRKMLSKAAGERFSSEDILFAQLLSASSDLHGKGELHTFCALVPKTNPSPRLNQHIDLHIPQNPLHAPKPIEPPQFNPVEAPPQPIERVVELTEEHELLPTEEIVLPENPEPPPTNFEQLNKLERIAIVFVILNTIAILYLLLTMS